MRVFGALTFTVAPRPSSVGFAATFPPKGKARMDPCSEQLTVLYKIPRLTLGMTKMSFIFRDPSSLRSSG